MLNTSVRVWLAVGEDKRGQERAGGHYSARGSGRYMAFASTRQGNGSRGSNWSLKKMAFRDDTVH